MSLETEIYGRPNSYLDDEMLSIGALERMLGISSKSIRGAAERAGIELEIERGENGNIIRRSLPVSSFPDLIRGFQEAKGVGGNHYHDWSVGVNTDGSTFELRVNHAKIRYTPPDNLE